MRRFTMNSQKMSDRCTSMICHPLTVFTAGLHGIRPTLLYRISRIALVLAMTRPPTQPRPKVHTDRLFTPPPSSVVISMAPSP